MKPHSLALSIVVGLAAFLVWPQPTASRLLAQGSAPVALRGLVKSAEEPSMEGVIVTLKKSGATIATSVVTNASGEFQFPTSRLEPGSYTMRMRAAGYD